MTFSQAAIEEFISDPVLAAYVFFEVELDVFQAARLRFMWYFPELIDSSGVSTGKTELIWILSNLRATILPRIQSILADQLAIKESEADPAKTLEELGADSLDFVEIILAVEEEFAIQVSDEKSEQIKTVADLVALVSP